ncbi:MAG TPA: POTRA domain-containing protein [Bacteroidales bacterium]|nr:POTRA domain-containing protein [Bacteroidales bacterium]
MRILLKTLLLVCCASSFLTPSLQGQFVLNDTANTKQEEAFIIGNISLQGNSTTKDRIILREIVFHTGDSLDAAQLAEKLEQSRRNLLNKSIFNFVEWDTAGAVDNNRLIHVTFNFIERWYIWPMPIFELADRNINAWWETKDFRKANYGIFLTYNNFRGRLEQLKVLIRAGYNQNYYLQYDIPYINKAQTIGIGFQLGYSLSREVPYLTINNKQKFFRSETDYARREWYARVKMTYRRNIHNSHDLTFGLEKATFLDTLQTLNPLFLPGDDPAMKMWHLNYIYKNDHRDSKPYPLNGHYADVDIHQYGLGLMKNEAAFTTLKTTIDFYRPISNRWFYAANITAKMSSAAQQPYYIQRGFGFGNDFVRSFELFVVDGKHFGLFKTNLKYALVTPRKSDLRFFKSEKFRKIHYAAYLNLFVDGGYVAQDKQYAFNSFQNEWLTGFGLGLDLVTYYDLVWRFECSVNRYNKPGFFLHFVAPI